LSSFKSVHEILNNCALQHLPEPKLLQDKLHSSIQVLHKIKMMLNSLLATIAATFSGSSGLQFVLCDRKAKQKTKRLSQLTKYYSHERRQL
jgi:hypothetical protein